MKKWQWAGIIVGALTALWVLAKVTGMVQNYDKLSPANEPGIKAGSSIWATNLKSYKRFDFVCYVYDSKIFGKGGIYTHRLCGLPGDTIEIIAARLFVNGEDVDKNLKLYKGYLGSKKYIESLMGKGLIDESSYNNKIYRMYEGKISFNGLESYFEKDSNVVAHLLEKGEQPAYQLPDFPHGDEYAFPDKGWNADYFGPVVVPEGMVFVLGDNRNNAADSRVKGFIKETAIRGVKF